MFARDENDNKLFPKATRYVTYKNGRPVWIEERFFDLNDHVYVWKKSRPKSEQELTELIGYLASQPLPEHLGASPACSLKDGQSPKSVEFVP